MNVKEIKELKRELAKVLVLYGINLKKQPLIIVNSVLDDIEFTNMVVEECYKTGAKRVIVQYHNEYTSRLNYLYGDSNSLSTYLPFETSMNNYLQDNYVPMIIIASEYFDALEGVDLMKVATITNKLRKIKYKNVSKIFSAHWTGVFIPSISWAKKLFPKFPIEEAMNKCWEIFLKVMRVEKNKTIDNWKQHLKNLKNRSKYLNSLNIDYLHYTSKNGTDLIVGMTDKPVWVGGTHLSDRSNREYNPNFPTEEVFTTPHRLRTEGIVYTSKSLCVRGKLIDGISFRFKQGKIVEIHAKSNEEIIKALVNQDPNCAYLGECALVPFSSPINQALPIFYSTIYDENACCHLAFGLGFDIGYKNHDKYSKKQLFNKGVNNANNHIDFMIGTKDLNIEATLRSGKRVMIFKNGEWAK